MGRTSPRCRTWTSDLENFHRMVDEYSGVEDPLDKAYTYQLYFNYNRENRWRDRMSAVQVLASEKDNNPGSAILSLPHPILAPLY